MADLFTQMIAGVTVISGAATAAQLSATSVPCSFVQIQAPPQNAGIAYLGDVDSQPWELPAGGGETTIYARDLNEIYVIGTAADVLNWIAYQGRPPA